MTARRVIIDTDPGLDDAVAILLAFASPELEVLGLTVVGMHALVYGLDIRGQHRLPEGRSHLAMFVSLSITGYVLALLTSAWVLWVLGRLDGLGHMETLHMVLVLGLPAGLGAAAARVVL